MPEAGKAEDMMRQVALGAVVAFALTVVVLSVCQPKADEAPPPAPVATPAPAVTPAPSNGAPVVGTALPVKPLMMRPTNAIRPELLQPIAAPPPPADAGAQ